MIKEKTKSKMKKAKFVFFAYLLFPGRNFLVLIVFLIIACLKKKKILEKSSLITKKKEKINYAETNKPNYLIVVYRKQQTYKSVYKNGKNRWSICKNGLKIFTELNIVDYYCK